MAAWRAREQRCQALVVATGPLDPEAQEDFRLWLQWFRDTSGIRGRRVVCLGTTETGWPVPPAMQGRRPPPDEVTLAPWKWPKQREQAGAGRGHGAGR